MGRSPAVVIIARHGARLDGADKKWHLTSPTPYDPPLTYGGWTQSRALGNRIGSLLEARESSSHHYHHHHHHRRHDGHGSTSNTTREADGSGADESKTPKNDKAPRRKHRIIIHTSPYLRCIQTAIAISSGIAQLDRSTQPNSHSTSRSAHSTYPHSHAVDSTGPLALSPISEPEEDSTHVVHKDKRTRKHRKATIRVDAFLGEWLSPDYFDLITPPPSSVMMVASAKADLLRREDQVVTSHSSADDRTAHGNFPGGWGSSWEGSSPKIDAVGGGPLSSLSSIGHGLPRKDHSSSHTSTGIGRPGWGGTARIATDIREPGGYMPPTPTYAISPSEPIPPGYVAHARDACVDVDYQWDSMREPQDWGDGGEYGEEWSSMHKRFRKGLNSMISWYRSHAPPRTPKDKNYMAPENQKISEEDDENDDTVLILVSHGAGCNALIGALTNQPVLLDVKMASLTMAVRKDILNAANLSSSASHQQATLSPRRTSSTFVGVSDDYDVKLLASTEHLRAGSNASSGSDLQSPASKTSFPQIPTYRHRHGSTASNSSPTDGFTIGEPAARSVTSGGYGPLHRSSSGASPVPLSFPNTARKGSFGLWGSPKFSAPEEDSGSGDDMVLNFGDGASDGKESQAKPEEKVTESDKENEKDNVTPLWGGESVERTHSQRGLWGAAPMGIANERERGPKRRWTIDEKRS